mgnify:CR=1 FL=1
MSLKPFAGLAIILLSCFVIHSLWQVINRSAHAKRIDPLQLLHPHDIKAMELHPLVVHHGAVGIRTIPSVAVVTNRSQVTAVVGSMKKDLNAYNFLPSLKHWTPDRYLKLVLVPHIGQRLAYLVSLMPDYHVAGYDQFRDTDATAVGDSIWFYSRGNRLLFEEINQLVNQNEGWVPIDYADTE